MTSGEHHHFVWLRPESEMAILLPLATSVQMGKTLFFFKKKTFWLLSHTFLCFIVGEFTVTVELSTQITRVVQELTINVAPEGSLVHRHTSVLLDLRARANVLRFMNIIVDETNIIPYEVYRRYVSGSARARLTISGDVVGPIFPAGEPVMLRCVMVSLFSSFQKLLTFNVISLFSEPLRKK